MLFKALGLVFIEACLLTSKLLIFNQLNLSTVIDWSQLQHTWPNSSISCVSALWSKARRFDPWFSSKNDFPWENARNNILMYAVVESYILSESIWFDINGWVIMYSYILFVQSYRMWACSSGVEHRTRSHKVVCLNPSLYNRYEKQNYICVHIFRASLAGPLFNQFGAVLGKFKCLI